MAMESVDDGSASSSVLYLADHDGSPDSGAGRGADGHEPQERDGAVESRLDGRVHQNVHCDITKDALASYVVQFARNYMAISRLIQLSPLAPPSMAERIFSPVEFDTITTGILMSGTLSFWVHAIFSIAASQPKEEFR